MLTHNWNLLFWNLLCFIEARSYSHLSRSLTGVSHSPASKLSTIWVGARLFFYFRASSVQCLLLSKCFKIDEQIHRFNSVLQRLKKSILLLRGQLLNQSAHELMHRQARCSLPLTLLLNSILNPHFKNWKKIFVLKSSLLLLRFM